ncbi:general stress protein [Sporosarcina oncorhynchi]|uniref:General stress protein n=1 Tax=Sporosarcina oncorhynchi TaxID=3056444 RepID=A0ABZ0L6P5_9BACL|nr:general stress protein [Sporosarcina sp. T2O-4]WOV88236.1 general stress protein [Sporosarcina sp. T2O-4]
MKKTFIGIYHTRDQLFSKIKQLQTAGFDDKDIYIVAKDEQIVEDLKNTISNDLRFAPSSIIDRFFGFLTGEDNVRSMLSEVGFSKDEANIYYQRIMNGSMIIYTEGYPTDDSLIDIVRDETRFGGYDPLTSDEIRAARINRD